MNELLDKKNATSDSSGGEPSPETIEVERTTRVFTASAFLVGVCLAVIGIFFMSCGLFHIQNVGEALLAFDSFLFG